MKTKTKDDIIKERINKLENAVKRNISLQQKILILVELDKLYKTIGEYNEM